MADQEVKVSITAQTSGLESGMQRAANATKQTAEAMSIGAEESKKLDDKLTSYLSKLDKGYAAQARLAEGVKLLDQNLQAGNISLGSYNNWLGKLEGAFGGAVSGALGHGRPPDTRLKWPRECPFRASR